MSYSIASNALSLGIDQFNNNYNIDNINLKSKQKRRKSKFDNNIIKCNY